MSNKTFDRKLTATAALIATSTEMLAGTTGEPMTPAPAGAAITGDGAGSALPPVEPQAPAPAPPHEWHDEFTGIGGSYVVIDGKRVPADQA